MASFPNDILSNGPEGKVLTREQAARSLVVTNIAPQTTDEDIVIYFQRQKNGGGEISHVHIPSKGTAVVTFDKNEGLYIELGSCYIFSAFCFYLTIIYDLPGYKCAELTSGFVVELNIPSTTFDLRFYCCCMLLFFF